MARSPATLLLIAAVGLAAPSPISFAQTSNDETTVELQAEVESMRVELAQIKLALSQAGINVSGAMDGEPAQAEENALSEYWARVTSLWPALENDYATLCL